MVEVVPDRIRAAATRMGTAATESRKHKPDEVGGVADALPGSTSGPLSTTLATTWGTRFGGWATAVESHVQAMRDAAEHWDETDAGVRARAEKQAREMDGAS